MPIFCFRYSSEKETYIYYIDTNFTYMGCIGEFCPLIFLFTLNKLRNRALCGDCEDLSVNMVSHFR